MGDIADMMIDGTLCEGCGVYMDGDGYGVPRRCPSCSRDDQPAPSAKVECPKCLKRVKAAGLADHLRDKHRA